MTSSFSFVRDADNGVVDISASRATTTPLTDRLCYATNAWYQDAHSDEIAKDRSSFSERLSFDNQSEEMLMALATFNPAQLTAKTKPRPKRKALAVAKEATASERRLYAKQFLQANLDEYKSWSKDNDIFTLVDMRKQKCQNFVTGRWVLTVKRDKNGNFQKCKARWVLRGFQDKQVTHGGFRNA